MDSQPFRHSLSYLKPTPAAKWGAVVCSALAALAVIGLVPVVYLAVDLLCHHQAAGDGGLPAAVARAGDGWWAGPLGWFASWNGWAATNEGLLAGLFAVAFALILIRGVTLNLSAYLSAVVAIDAAGRLRRAILTHSSRLGGLAIRPDAQAEAGDVITRKVEQLQDGWIARLTAGVRAPTLGVAAVAVLAVVNLWLALAVVCLIGAVWLVAGLSAVHFRRDARLAARRADARLAVMRENLTFMQVVKSYLMERFNQARVERQLNELAKATRRRLRSETLARPTLFAVGSLTGAVLAYVAARVVLGGGLTLAGLAVAGCAVTALGMSVQRWIAARVRLRRAKEAAADVFEFLDRRADATQPIDAEFLQPMSKRLELTQLSYREPGTGRMKLEDVSFTMSAGDRAAVVCGDPDEGRTLAYLLTRFLEPTGGEIKIDGKNLRWVTFDSLRTQVALVLQDGTTFSDTVANNIGCGDPSYTLPQIIEAAKLTHAHQFVSRLPYGYETQLGDAGVTLRPGERFRIALARAVLRDPSLIVIEEPTEPFDPDSVALIDDAVTRLLPGRTVLFLARRSTTVKSADRVFYIQDGKLVSSTTSDETRVGGSVIRPPSRAPQPRAETSAD